MEKNFLVSKGQVNCLAAGYREAVYDLTGCYSLAEEAGFLVRDGFYENVSHPHQKFVFSKKFLAELGKLVSSVIGTGNDFKSWRTVAKRYVRASNDAGEPLSRDLLATLDELCFETLSW